MDGSIIHHRLGLSVHLVDTTTGGDVTEYNVRFYREDKEVMPHSRGDGTFVFIDTERENCTLRIKAYGYEEANVLIDFEELDRLLPVKEVYLVPGESLGQGESLRSLSGYLKDLETIDAVRFDSFYYSARKYDERKNLLNILRAMGPNMSETVYGMVNKAEQSFEAFTVDQVKTESMVHLKGKLSAPFVENSPVSRVVFGTVTPEGRYILRVRDDSNSLTYLVRYRVKGTYRFKLIDFHAENNELKA